MFTYDHAVKGMLHLKEHSPAAYFDKIISMREEYHRPKMSDDARTINHWDRQDQFTEDLFFALGETLSRNP